MRSRSTAAFANCFSLTELFFYSYTFHCYSVFVFIGYGCSTSTAGLDISIYGIYERFLLHAAFCFFFF